MSLPSREFLQEVNSATKLIIWISDESLNLKTPGIRECDYLCDGLINDFLKNATTESVDQNIFHTQSFGEKLFLAFYKYSKTTLADIDDAMGLIGQTADVASKPKIILIQTQDKYKDLLAELIRRYRQFEIITYSF